MLTTPPGAVVRPQASFKLHRVILTVNGCFLAVVGGAQLLFEMLSCFFGVGPLGAIFAHSPYTIGFVEAHGLALLIGVLLLCIAAPAPRPAWHLFAASAHVLLGGANLLFWSSFITWGLVPGGVVATICHALLLAAELWCGLRAAPSWTIDGRVAR